MADKKAETTTTDEVANLKQTLKARAMQKLRDAHKAEYEKIATELFKAEGLEFVHVPTKEERQLAQLEALAKELGVEVKPRTEG